MQDAADEAGEPTEWECPTCFMPVDLTSATTNEEGLVHCPVCGDFFALDSPDTAAPHPAADALDYALPGTPADRRGDFAQELDGLRIRQVSTLRRGTSRARSYLVIAVIVSAVASVQLVLMTIDYVAAGGWGLTPVGYLLFVGVLLMLAGYFGRRALELHRELQTPPPLPPVEGEPDFTTLSDGSQHWKNLEDIR